MSVLDNVVAGRHALLRTGIAGLVVGSAAPPVAKKFGPAKRRWLLPADRLGLAGVGGGAGRPAAPTAISGASKIRARSGHRARTAPPRRACGRHERDRNWDPGREFLAQTQRPPGLTMVVIEHHIDLIVAVSDELIVLNFRAEDRARSALTRCRAPRPSSKPIWGEGDGAVARGSRTCPSATAPIEAVRGISFEVADGEDHGADRCQAGPEKTSTLSRARQPASNSAGGRVRFGDEDVTAGWPAERLVRAGMAHVPEGGAPSTTPLTVLENLWSWGRGWRGGGHRIPG